MPDLTIKYEIKICSFLRLDLSKEREGYNPPEKQFCFTDNQNTEIVYRIF
jgi:hypothetical protein